MDIHMTRYFLRGVLILFTVVLFACDGNSSGTESLERAKNFLLEGKKSSAIIELKNTLLKNDKNHEARWLLGKIYFDQGSYVDAVKELNWANELGPYENDSLPLLALSYLELNELNKLSTLSLVEVTNSQARSTVLSAQGLGKLRGGDKEAAAELVSQALVEEPNILFAKFAELKVSYSNGISAGETRKKLNALLRLDPEYSYAWSLLGDIELQSTHFDLAEEAYSNAIAFGRRNFKDSYKRGLVRLQLGDINGAEADINVLDKALPNHPGAHYLKGLILFKKKSFKDAIYSFDISSQVEGSYPMSLFYLAVSHLQEKNFVQAENFAYNFLSIQPENVSGRKLLAGLKLKSGADSSSGEEVEELLKPVLEGNPGDIEALSMMSGAKLLLGKQQESIDILKRINQLQPESSVAKMQLGASLLSIGENEGGLELLESAIDIDPGLKQAHILIAATHIRDGQFEKALMVAGKFAEKYPDSEAPYNLYGKIHLSARRNEDAKEAFSKALTLAPGDLTASQNLAALAIGDKQFDKARRYYLGALEHNEPHLNVLLRLAALEEIEKNQEAMVSTLEKAMESHPQVMKPRVLLARYYLSQSRPELVSNLFTGVENKLLDNQDVINVMGLSKLHLGLYREAVSAFQKLSKLRPGAPQPKYHLGKSYLGVGEIDKAKKEFSSAIELYPEYLGARISLAKVHLQELDRPSLEKQLSFLKTVSPDNPEVIQLMAAKYRLDGDQLKALSLSEKAYQLEPTSRNMLVLARQKTTMGDLGSSRQLLSDWVEKNPSDNLIRQEFASFLLAHGQESEAISHYNKILRFDKLNVVALNNLAWLWRDTKPETALKYAQQAVEQSQDSPLALDTLAVVLLKNNEMVKAQRTIDRALEKSPDNPSIKYHHAMINAAAGEKAKAKKYLKELLSGEKEFPERQEAEALLKTL